MQIPANVFRACPRRIKIRVSADCREKTVSLDPDNLMTGVEESGAIDSGPEDINLALDARFTLEVFNPALVLFLDHQGSPHINLQIYKKICHRRAGPEGVFPPGSVVEVSPDESRALIAGGYAEPIPRPAASPKEDWVPVCLLSS